MSTTKYQSTLTYSNNRSCTQSNLSPLAIGLRKKYGFFSARLHEASLPGLNENLVLGIATSYGADILNYFLVSLRQTGYAGKVVIITHDFDLAEAPAALDHELEALFESTHTEHVFYGSHELNESCENVRRLQGMRFSTVSTRKFLLSLTPATMRFIIYWDYLQHLYLPKNPNSYILHADTKDVWFQTDISRHPSINLEHDVLHPVLEGVASIGNKSFGSKQFTLSQQHVNVKWLRACYGSHHWSVIHGFILFLFKQI